MAPAVKGPPPRKLAGRGKSKGKAPIHHHHGVKPTFPAQKVQYILEGLCPRGITVAPDATIYLTAVLEYVAAEILEHASHTARLNTQPGSDAKISESNVMDVITHDEALNQLIVGALQANGETRSK